MTRAALFLFMFVFFSAAASAEPQIASPVPGLESYVAEVLKKSAVPGAAIAIVKDGQVIFARGFGLRDREQNLPVTENTLFAIGSTTKAMTATAAGMLVDQGLLDLRRPVIEYIPDFRLKDEQATLKVNLIDLMAHRTGVPRHDIAWYGYDAFPRSYFWERLKYLEPSAGLREQWQYNNFMFMAAGYIVEKISGKTWEDFLQQNLFQKLGMIQTNFSVEATEASADFARPYSMRAGALTRVPMRPIVGMGPAGSVNSNVAEMAKWLQFNIDGGVWNGQALLTAATMQTIHQPHMILPRSSPPYPEFSYPAYALGWTRQHFRGNDLIWHTGGIDGFLTFVGFMPAQRIGVVVFQNADSEMIMLPLALRAFDEVLQVPAEDWLERQRQLPQGGSEKKEYARGPVPRPLADYAGTFEHPAYGSIAISESNGSLAMSFHDMQFTLEHLNNGLFRMHSAELPEVSEMEPLYFQVDGNGAISELRIRLEPAVAPIAFVRRP